MNNCNAKFVRSWWVLTALVVGFVLLDSTRSSSQEKKSAETAEAAQAEAPGKATAAESAAKEAEKSSAADETKNELSAPTSEPTGESSASAKDNATAPSTGAPPVGLAPLDDKSAPPKESSTPTGKTESSSATKTTQETVPQEQAQSGSSTWLLAITLLALFILPILAGNYLARIWRMPDHGWKFSLVLFGSAGSVLICLAALQHWWGTQFKFGPDLAGGITLIYEVADATSVVASDQEAQQPGSEADSAIDKSGGREVSLDKLIGALKRRIDPDGTKEITLRGYGPKAIEIIIPQVGQDEMEFVKQKITKIGQLEFRITADPNLTRDRKIVELARRTPPNQRDVFEGDKKVAEWVPYDVKSFGPFESESFLVKRMAGDTPEALVLLDPFKVTGDYLTRATKGIDDTGKPAVHFSFNQQGATRFERLTGQNLPNPATGNVYRHLGIILDKLLVNAPVIEDKISSEGRISGSSMTDKEVELTIEVLNAGSLPASLDKTPISEDIISPTLGGVTVQKGKEAIIASLIAVVLFMIVYYRFAGVVASIGLVLNLIIVLAVMVLINAAFTLPGIAGLALTVGMSVDTNVLIYERIREELAGGAALRMAIRNGFGRAMSAIIDTHLTTIISGIVLFWVGTDQVKGFAVTLILGLLVNLFTAFFCTRVMFDVAERRGYIKQLKMMKLFANPNIDFLRFRWVAIGATSLLILIGMIAVYYRGEKLLDIDFTGGSSVAFTLRDPMPLAKVRNTLANSHLGNKNLLVVAHGNQSIEYTVDSSEESVDVVKQVINSEFGDKLKKYTFEFKDLKQIKQGDFNGIEARLFINTDSKDESGLTYEALRDQIASQLAKNGHGSIQPILINPEYRRGSSARFKEWSVRIAGLDEAAAKPVLEGVQKEMRDTAIFPLASKIGGRVSGDMKWTALKAIVFSLVAMILYLWLRFAKPAYGIAAGVALLHDVLFTVGMLALSHYIVQAMPAVAQFLRIESFQINLTIVAALLTIIGFSVNDTVVTFDRLREIKGKSPKLTAKMANDAVNQTLSRTMLTVFTVFIVVVILYFFGGEGLHSFAFAFLVGIVTGTYSSVYIAAPVVLWLSGVSAAPVKEEVQSMRGMQPAR